MSYTKLSPTDRVVQYPNRYKDQNNNQLTLTRDEGTVITAGTSINASNLSHLDDGIFDAHQILGSATSADLTKLHALTADANELNYVDGVTSAIQTQLNGKTPNDGWVSASETWTYVSVDDPTGVIKVQANVTTKYSVGMRLKFTNGGNTIFGIITKMGTYGGDVAGYTYITFLHEIDPSDSLALYLMANSAITNNFYSSMKTPYGFPAESTKWTITVVYNSLATQDSPVQNTWYNLGTVTIAIPIGNWRVQAKGRVTNIAGSSATYIAVTLSTANNSESDADFTYAGYAGLVEHQLPFYVEKTLLLTSKTTYYLNERTTIASTTRIRLDGGEMKAIIRAICAYL